MKRKITSRKRRARRVRTKVYGTAERPRMSVSRSLNNMYVQLVDDDRGLTLLGVSTTAEDVKNRKTEESGRVAVAKELGKAVAEKAKEKGITKAVFDRNGFLYHGRVRAVAEGAREGGLKL